MNGQTYVGDASIESSTFKANNAAYGGAIENDGTLTVTTCMFTDNTASKGDGGAIFSTTSIILTDNTFVKNTAANGDGGAVAYEPEASVEPANPEPAEPAEPTEPAKPAEPATPAAPAAANAVPMAVVVNASAAKKETNNVITTSITNCTFSYNEAEDGGAILSDSTIIINNCTFTGNTAVNGDGGAVAYEPEAVPAKVSPPTKSAPAPEPVKSAATAAPMAVEVYASAATATPAVSITASITNCKFTDNTAVYGGFY